MHYSIMGVFSMSRSVIQRIQGDNCKTNKLKILRKNIWKMFCEFEVDILLVQEHTNQVCWFKNTQIKYVVEVARRNSDMLERFDISEIRLW